MFLENEQFVRIRYTQSVVNHEKTVTEDSRTTFNDGSVQPMTEEEIEKIETADLERADYKHKLITAAELRGPDAHADKPADEVEYDDTTYKIQEISGGYSALIQHNSYALIRKQE